MKNYALLLIAALAFAGCGQQDPLADQPDYIKKATPGFNKPDAPVATAENMIISANTTHFFFTEGIEGQSTITGRILLENYDASLSIENLADFEGATFDPATGIFQWKPNKGVVNGVNSSIDTFLRVRLNGLQRETNITATRTADFPVTISRMESQPTIVKEAGFPSSTVREGESLRLTFFIKDQDGVNVAGGKPRIIVQAPKDEPRVGDLTPFLRVVSEDDPEQDFSDPSVWKFTVNVALTDADLTKNSGDFYFRITAVSRFGKFSATKDYKVTVITSVQKPIVSGENFEVRAGSSMTQDILVMDPRQEGKISVQVLNQDEFPANFAFNCEYPSNTPWMGRCRASWDTTAPVARPAADPIGVNPTPPAATEAVVKIKAINTSPLSFDRQTNSQPYTLTFKVVSP